jgi:hypothetical protein
MKANWTKKEIVEEVPYCEMLEDAKQITGRNYSKRWEVEVVKKINIFKLEVAAGKAAIEEGWFGAIYDNYIVAPFGLANYLFEIFSREIFISQIWSTNPKAHRPARPINEFSSSELCNFKEWLVTPDFYGRAKNNRKIDIVVDRRDDLLILRKVGLATKKNTE